VIIRSLTRATSAALRKRAMKSRLVDPAVTVTRSASRVISSGVSRPSPRWMPKSLAS
jgi:hypothetical protein